MIDNTCVIYTNGSQECERVAALLKSLGGEYHEYVLDCHFSQRAFEAEFGKDAEYPQVAIGPKHIGSLKDTLHYCQEQGLLV
jgi:glutaredoxin